MDYISEYKERRAKRIADRKAHDRRRFDAEGDWKEELHPRAKDGKFTSGSGSSGGSGKEEKQNKKESQSESSGSRKYVSADRAKNATSIGGYRRENNFKNGYGVTEVGEKEKADVKSGITLRMHTNDAGEFTEEREALHSKFIDDSIRGIRKPDGRPVTTFLGGGPASGKSTVAEKMADQTGIPTKGNAVVVDPDEAKKALPEFDPDNPSPVHEESSALAKRLTRIAQENGYNTTVDGTGDGSVESMRKKIQQAKDLGHTVNGRYVFVPTETAIIRNAARDRSVNNELLINTHAKVSKILPQIAKDFDDCQLYYSGDNGPELIARGGGGKDLAILNHKLYQMFLDNANYTYDEDRVNHLLAMPEAQKKKKKR